MRDEDRYREITDEADFADDESLDREPAQPEPDLREVAATEPRQRDEDLVRVPSADETATAIQRAQRALREISYRQAADSSREAEERSAQLARWHSDDRSAEQTRTAGYESPGLDRSSHV